MTEPRQHPERRLRGEWFRIPLLGCGLSWRPDDGPIFSERYGYVTSFVILGWRFRVLRRER
jgi:hypothetical protein